MLLFRKKIEIEYSEKEIVDDYIYNLIVIANNNNDKDNDYISIIAILYKLKETYSKFNNIYDKYLKQFNDKGFLKIYEINKYKNGTYISLNKLSQFDEPSWDLIPTRYIWFSTCLALLGEPKNAKITNRIAKWCSWNLYSFSKPAIYYTKLLINQGFYDEDDGNYYDSKYLKMKKHRFNIYIQLADNYIKIKDYNQSLIYYKIALKLTNKNDFYKIAIRKIIKVYKYQHKANELILFLKLQRKMKILNIEIYKFLTKELNTLENEKNEIFKHDFNGYNRVESFYGTFDNYKLKEKEYEQLIIKYKNIFDEHINRIDRISNIMTTEIIDENINEFIELIKRDIENFHKIENFYKELNSFGLINNYYYSDNYVKGYLLPKETIIFLEKRNYINEAIKICDIAIENNITWDNTKGGIVGRRQRLIKKIFKQVC